MSLDGLKVKLCHMVTRDSASGGWRPRRAIRRRAQIVIVLSLLMGACTKKEPPVTSLPDMSAVRANLAFTCTHQV